MVDDDGDLQYGIYSSTEATIWQLSVDNSGFSTPVARTDPDGDPLDTPFDTSDWDENDWENYTSKVSRWGAPSASFRPISGEMANTFPQDEGWIVDGNEDEVYRLSQLSINRVTKILTARRKGSGPPNCEKKWHEVLFLLPDTIPWKIIWRSIGTFLTSPADEKVWWCLLHRKMYVVSHDAKWPSDKCRACRRHRESILHLTDCNRFRKVKLWILEALTILGVDTSNLSWHFAWIFGVDSNWKLLPEVPRALLRLAWRAFMADLTKVRREKTIYKPENTIKYLASLFASRILAYQESNNLFYLGRRYSALKFHLPRSAANKVASLGELDLHSGELTITVDLRGLLDDQGAWTDFNESPAPAN